MSDATATVRSVWQAVSAFVALLGTIFGLLAPADGGPTGPVAPTTTSATAPADGSRHAADGDVRLGAASAMAADVASGVGFAPGAPLPSAPAELARDFDAMAASGATWVRLDLDWPAVERVRGRHDWTHVDRLVGAATSRGLRVLAMPAYTPAWARPAGTSDKHPPSDPADFARFAGAAAQRYAPRGVRHWEIWNEPNLWRFWESGPDPAAYTRLLRAASAAVKAVDPGATVVTGGLSPATDDGGRVAPVTFLRGVYDAGGGDAFDAVGHHPYHFPCRVDTPGDWNAWWAVTPRLRQLMEERGDGHKRIWLTEYGAPTGSSERAVSEEDQAAMARQALLAAQRWEWTGPLFWYAVRDKGPDPTDPEQNFGLLRRDGSAKPAWSAFRDGVAALRSGRSPLPADSGLPVPGSGGPLDRAGCLDPTG